MKKPDFKKGWAAVVHWKGWKHTASACKKAWYATIRWAGWNILFGLPVSLVLLLSVVSAAGLIWVFVQNRTEWIPAYFLYALSAYSLAALCVKLPCAIRGGKDWFSRNVGMLDKESRWWMADFIPKRISRRLLLMQPIDK